MSKVDFQKEYKKLNDSQRKAVDAVEGPVMVIAGPGTGKTTLLTLRIANILLKTDASPENILALTFTNSGVSAMRNKLVDLIGDEAYRVNIFTFHSFAENIIKEFSFYFKDLENAKVITDLDKVKILEEIIKKGDYKELVSKNDPFSSLNDVRNAISKIKAEGLDPEQFKAKIPEWKQELLSSDDVYYKRKYKEFNVGDIKPSEEEKINHKVEKAYEIADVFLKYQEIIKEKGNYDFSDMILNVLKELESNENLKSDLQEKYQYLLIDEHQDTNEGQNRLIELLTDAEHLNRRPNIFTVGDEKQSIYRFQGASEETFSHLHDIYDDILVINLEDNYRSTQTILDASHGLILNSVEDAFALNSHKEKEVKITTLDFSNYKFELLFIANDIKKKIESGVDPKDIAVIYPKNKHVEDLKSIFNQKEIPHTILSKENILEDKNINNLISILRVVHNFNDNHNLAKCFFVDFLNFDSYESLEILNNFRKQNRNDSKKLFDFILDEKTNTSTPPTRFAARRAGGNGNGKKLFEFSKKIKELKTLSKNSNFITFLKNFIEEIGYLDFLLNSKDSRDQLIKLDKLFDEVKRQMSLEKNYSLEDFLKFIDSYQKYNLDIETNNPEIIDGVKLMTAHKSKGLEFECVYMINSTSKNWEKNRGGRSIDLPIEDYKGDIHDSRRLFYVAMTRAKNELYISSSLTDWEGKEQEKTQFVAELDEKYLEEFDTNKFEKEKIDELVLFVRNFDGENTIWDKEYLANLFLEKSLSVTSLNNYVSCPIKYLFRNLIQLPSEYSPSLLYGNLIHESLEKFFRDSKEENKILDKKVLLDYFKKAIDLSSFYDEEYDRYLARGEEALSEYYDNYSKDWIFDIDTERHVKRKFELKDKTEISLSGILDKVENIDGSKEKINVVDYKTGSNFSEKTKEQKEDLKRQIVFYHLLMAGSDEKVKIEKAVLDFVEKNKKGEFEQHSIDVTEEDLDDLSEEINQMAKEILSGEFLKKGCQKKDCEYCGLK